MDQQKIFFNSSLPRSGSTLLQNILAQNPSFYCSPTSGLFELLYAARNVFSAEPQFKAQDPKLMRRGLASFCRAGLQGFYQGITDKPIVVDKSRGWFYFYDWLDEFYPKPKILVCVRDLRGILSSMEKLWRKNRHIADPADHQPKMNMITIPNRVGHWLNSVPVGISVTRLMDAVQLGNLKHVHIVRFEDLTANPKATMDKVYAYLGEPSFAHDFENVEQVTQEDDSQYPIYGDHTIRQQVRPVPPDWHEVLGKDVAAMVRQDNAAFYQTFYKDR